MFQAVLHIVAFVTDPTTSVSADRGHAAGASWEAASLVRTRSPLSLHDVSSRLGQGFALANAATSRS
jgi:hypothetical protein